MSQPPSEPPEPSEADLAEFRAFLRYRTDRELPEIYLKEHQAGRRPFARLVAAEAARRDVDLFV